MFVIFGGYDVEMMNLPPSAMVERIFDKAAIERCLGLSATRVSHFSPVVRFIVGVDPGSSMNKSNSVIISFALVYSALGYQDLPTETPMLDQHLLVRPPCPQWSTQTSNRPSRPG